MQKLLFSLFLIAAGLTCGYLLQQAIRRKTDQCNPVLARLRKFLQRFSTIGIMPITFVTALWVAPFGDLRVALLPVLGAGIWLAGGGLGLATAAILKKSGSQKSVLFCCGCFSNLGSLGGLTSFLFFGEQGFALLALYKLFEHIIYFSFGFPFARYLKSSDSELRDGNRLLDVLKDPLFLVATVSIAAGICLNLSGAVRPGFFGTLNSILIPIGLFLILVSVGLGMQFANVRHHLVEGLAISLIKFILLPVFAGGAAYLLGLHQIQDGLPLKIALIGASMPVAFMALVAASLYDLDLDLANSCWLMTTGALVVVLPTLYFLFSLF